ncbi:unnamed protein product (macronuclear) [Paramecium tetraurelia]|uniref:Uncharacterized protein n=1 Tax=Paramecium tetraurelia TaxID=5888 RepID=A0CMV7_PARTE|nr:uncharacterized protein GSPATT00038741001 [Paramecium tetraurelia]CAK72124.1 unnamed protein product [Paramecium tetraurelia]|eukprot:XP_001439521.1 hypothetical protein (macronuclear) [Paramecium tetraurelia strain d4-2]
MDLYELMKLVRLLQNLFKQLYYANPRSQLVLLIISLLSQDLPIYCSAKKHLKIAKSNEQDHQLAYGLSASYCINNVMHQPKMLKQQAQFLQDNSLLFKSFNCVYKQMDTQESMHFQQCLQRMHEQISNCNKLAQINCTIGSKVSGGDCNWDGLNYVDKTCTNFIKITHNKCQYLLDQCAVNNGQMNCQTWQNSCSSYSIQDNCVITSQIKKCIWIATALRNTICAHFHNTYNSDQECQSHPVSDDTCTVVYKIGGLGFVLKTKLIVRIIQHKSNVIKTISNYAGVDDCKWSMEKCYSLSTFAAGACWNIQNWMHKTGLLQKKCSRFNIHRLLSIGYNMSSKKKRLLNVLLVNLLVNGEQSASCFRFTDGLCVRNSAVPPTCQSVAQASDYALQTGLTGLDHSKCQAYNSLCTSVSDGTGCQIISKVVQVILKQILVQLLRQVINAYIMVVLESLQLPRQITQQYQQDLKLTLMDMLQLEVVLHTKKKYPGIDLDAQNHQLENVIYTQLLLGSVLSELHDK